MKSFDYYSKARKFSETLKNEGEQEYAQKLLDALDEGCTGTEILMALKYHLGFLINLETISSFLRQDAGVFFEEIEKTLNQ